MNSLRTILEGVSLEDKLTPFDFNDCFESDLPTQVKCPGRNQKISFSDKQMKFPKPGSLKNKDQRAKAIHFFANHELLALEIFVHFYLKFLSPLEGERKLKLHVLQTIKEEQKHLKLYIDRMNELGIEFGDFPLNDFFWRQFKEIKTMNEFFSSMSLTFEVANLDFAFFYSELFKQYEDYKSSEIMDIVLKDELRHVNVGVKYLSSQKGEEDLWNFYKKNLPKHISPSRGKGLICQKGLRLQAGLNEDFTDKQIHYQSDFNVLNRREMNL